MRALFKKKPYTLLTAQSAAECIAARRNNIGVGCGNRAAQNFLNDSHEDSALPSPQIGNDCAKSLEYGTDALAFLLKSVESTGLKNAKNKQRPSANSANAIEFLDYNQQTYFSHIAYLARKYCIQCQQNGILARITSRRQYVFWKLRS